MVEGKRVVGWGEEGWKPSGVRAWAEPGSPWALEKSRGSDGMVDPPNAPNPQTKHLINCTKVVPTAPKSWCLENTTSAYQDASSFTNSILL